MSNKAAAYSSPINAITLQVDDGIKLIDVSKRFNKEWIFRKFNYHFKIGKSYAITGTNGSGKSTLLQIIAGAIMHNEGSIQFKSNHQIIEAEKHYQYIAFASPYLDLIEEMTATEMLDFHLKFKPLIADKSIAQILQMVGLQNASHKQIRNFSSGMKQRLKLAQAFFSNIPFLLLDEPTTNLDAEGIALYQLLITNYTKNKLVIVCSNDKQEYAFCDEVIEMSLYK
jgi:ABC-type multidrug transport system ATPase subunit